jgi:hypothetical protein
MSTASNAAWKARDPVGVKRNRSAYVAQRRARIDALKTGPCADCGNVFPPECMDFDHVRGNKAIKVSALVACSAERLMAEVAKCDLVCANCHRIRTRARLA